MKVLLGLTCILMLAAGCADGPEPSAVVPAPPSATGQSVASVPAFDEAQVARWVRFRTEYGLRSDLDWVLQVARDPSAANEMTVPLLPAEIGVVAARNLSVQELVPHLRKYGETFPDEFAGAFIDGTKAVVQFTDRVDEHRASLATMFGPDLPDVRGTRFALEELEDFANRVEADRSWFATVDAELYQVELSEQDNTVMVRYFATDDLVEPRIAAHFGNPDWMRLSRDGPPPWTGARGTLRVTVVDGAGRPIEADCVPVPMDERVRDSFLPKTVRNGVCEVTEIPAIDWDVQISYIDRSDEVIKVSQQVRVPDGGVGTATIVVDP